MLSLTDEENDNFEKEFHAGLKNIYLIFQDELFSNTNSFLNLSTKSYAEKLTFWIDFLAGEKIVKFELIPSIYNYFIKNLTSISNTVHFLLDKKNKVNLINAEYLERFHKKALFYRRWRIQANNTTRTFKRLLKYAIDKAILENKRPRSLKKDVEEILKKYNLDKAHNSLAIARTEMFAVVRNTEFDYAKKFQKQLKIKLEKSWIRRFDERTRLSHIEYHNREINGWIDFNKKFQSPATGLQILYPLHASGEAKDVINCRCKMKYREKR